MRAGVYEVTLRLRCPAADAGSRVQVTVGKATLEGRVPEAELPLGEWKVHALGPAQLAPGEQTLTVQALSRPGQTVMELDAVILRGPGPPPR